MSSRRLSNRLTPASLRWSATVVAAAAAVATAVGVEVVAVVEVGSADAEQQKSTLSS